QARGDRVGVGEHLERVGDGAGLLEDLLLHVVVVVAQLDRVGRDLALDDRALGRVAVGIHDPVAVAPDLDDVAFLEVADVAGHLEQRRGVRREEVLALAAAAVADAEQQRRAAARADDGAGLPGADRGDGVRALEFADGQADRFEEARPALHVVMDLVGDGLGVGVRLELVALGAQLAAQGLVVLDDAVVHHADFEAVAAGVVRMRVVLGDAPVRGPAGVGDAGRGAGLRLAGAGRQVGDASHGPYTVDAPVQRGEAGGVIPAVLELAQAFDEDGDDIALGDGPYDSAHLARSLDSSVLVDGREAPFTSCRV